MSGVRMADLLRDHARTRPRSSRAGSGGASPSKLPRRIHTTDALPKTPTGKVLKRELRRALADGSG